MAPIGGKWKSRLGARLKELREQAHGGTGVTQQRAADTIGKTVAYVNRLENQMEGENPSVDMLFQLCSLYGVEIGELFRPLVSDLDIQNAELKDKLDFIMSSGVQTTITGITENLHAMYDRAKKLRRKP